MTEPAAGFPRFAWRSSLGDIFRGVTWPRVGVFVFFCAWLSFGSAPTAGPAYAGDWPGALQGWLEWTLALALCYGLPALVLVALANRPPRSAWRATAAMAGGILAGSLLYAGIIWFAYMAPRNATPSLARVLAIVLEGIVESGIVSTVAWVLTRRDRSISALRQEELARVAIEREVAEARVMALQSQIEPHFLFNTLANVRRLLATDRAAGRLMVRQLSQYLRSTLPQLRDSRSTLGRELALTTAYLSVQQVRMGERLAVTVDVPARLAAATFPPMMLMTLVENAIKHGLAPMPAGGHITICAEEAAEHLVVKVVDTGAGIRSTSGAGIGIANTRARLAALFGAGARLRIGNNEGGGVTASIEIPLLAGAAA
ncbi:MAG: histidine kinase [Burkholderiales bacterium]